MQDMSLFICVLVLLALAFALGRLRSRSQNAGVRGQFQHSLPNDYGYLAAAWTGIPALILLGLGLILEDRVISEQVVNALPQSIRDMPQDQIGLYYNQIVSFAEGRVDASELNEAQIIAGQGYVEATQRFATIKSALVLLVAFLGGLFALKRITPALRARYRVERLMMRVLFACSFLAVLTTAGIVFSVLFEAVRFFQIIPISDFILGLEWSPQMAIRADQVAASGSFGFVPLLVGTLLISAVAMLIAVPVGLMSAIYLSEYASPGFRSVTKPILEILAGVPTVVYGFFAALTVAPQLRQLGESLGVSVASESALAAGLVMGIMIIPFVMSLSDDILKAVPSSLREASLGMGATMSETIGKVLLPAALPGIVGGILLAISRAIGETMIVVMAAGLSAKLTANPLEAVTTITVQIVTLLVGDQEFDSPKTLAAFALGLVLFFVTLLLNVIALYVVRRYREQYE
jgi:phosphate transport system permease protein